MINYGWTESSNTSLLHFTPQQSIEEQRLWKHVDNIVVIPAILTEIMATISAPDIIFFYYIIRFLYNKKKIH